MLPNKQSWLWNDNTSFPELVSFGVQAVAFRHLFNLNISWTMWLGKLVPNVLKNTFFPLASWCNHFEAPGVRGHSCQGLRFPYFKLKGIWHETLDIISFAHSSQRPAKLFFHFISIAFKRITDATFNSFSPENVHPKQKNN